MKRIFSFVIAAVAAFSFSVSALAADDNGGMIFIDENGNITRNSSAIAPRINLGDSGTVAVEDNEIVIVDTKTKTVITPETRLMPGEEYTFNLYRVTSPSGGFVSPSNVQITPIKKEDLDGGRLRVRATKGSSALSSVKIEEKGSSASGTFNLVVTTRENWGTKITDVEYVLSATGLGVNAVALVDGNAIFKVGYPRFKDEEIDAYSEGDIITILPDDAVVILKKQFETLAKSYNYKAVEFEAEDAGWTYTGRVSGMGDTNFYYTYDVIPSIITKFEDQDFKFITFPAGVTFPTNGEMRIDVSDISGDFNRMYTYLYRNGVLTRVNATYDSGADQIVFRTNYLGAFVITNEEITDTTIIEGTQPTEPAPTPTEPGVTGNVNNTTNPNTGAADLTAAASFVAMAAAAAGYLFRKK